MKRILTFVLAFVMIASLSVSAFAIEGIPAYDGNYDEGPGMNAGEINANKHASVEGGYAGDMSHAGETAFIVPGVKDDAIPKIDGKLQDGEGYEDMDGFADYLYIGANMGKYSGADFSEWYNEVKDMPLTMKYCWDGNYIYFYIEYTVKQYVCNANSAMDLWKWNCIQLGLADKDAVEAGERSETLYGINSFTEVPMSGMVAGSYLPKANEDYSGNFVTGDGGVTKVVHEFRAPINKALGYTDPALAGDVIRCCIVVMNCNNGASDGQKFVSFGHGITGQKSNKFPQNFVCLTLGQGYDPNAVENYEPYYIPTADEKEADYRENVSFFFHQIKDTDDFADELGTGTKTVATDDNKYATFTTTAELARFTSEIYPGGLWGAGTDVGSSYAAIRYRTTTEGIKLGLNFINNGMLADPEKGETEPQFIPEAVAYPISQTEIEADGQWHDAIIKLTDSSTFNGLLVKTGIEISAGSIDIESIKFFGWDPTEIVYKIVEDPGYCTCGDECGDDCFCKIAGRECIEDVCECSCNDEAEHEHNFVEGKCECGETDPNYKKPNNGTTETPDNGNTNVQKPAKKKGCKSSIAAGAAFVVVATIASGAVVLKKKED